MSDGGHPSEGSQADILGAILRELRKRGIRAKWEMGKIITAPTTTTDILRARSVPGWAIAIYGYMVSVEEACNLYLTWPTADETRTLQIPVASEGTIVLIIDGEAALNEGQIATGDIYVRPKVNATAGKDYQVSLLVERRRIE